MAYLSSCPGILYIPRRVGLVRQFGSGARYHPMLYVMTFGALIRRRPRPFASKSHPDLVHDPAHDPLRQWSAPPRPLWWALFPSTSSEKRIPEFWWAKFNYVSGVGLDTGTGLAIIAMFLAFVVGSFTPLTLQRWLTGVSRL